MWRPALFMKSVFISVFLCLMVLAAPARAQDTTPQPQQDYVVLLHGIGRSASAMDKMADDLRGRGYAVLNLNYESRKYDIAALAARMDAEVTAFNADKTRRINFVGHSMGALVIRAYLHQRRPENLGRVVAIGSPNSGSEVADFLSAFGAYESFYGPAGQQLTTTYDLSQVLDKKPNYEVGVIAGDRTIDPLSTLIIPGADDGKVSIKSTHIDGEKDHIVLHANHATMPMNAAVIIETAHFLQYGFFKHSADAASHAPAEQKK